MKKCLMIFLIRENKICGRIEIPHDKIDLMKTASLIKKHLLIKIPETVKFNEELSLCCLHFPGFLCNSDSGLSRWCE